MPNPQNQGTLLNTITFPEFTDLVRREFNSVQQMVEPRAKQLFITEPVNNGQGDTKRKQEVDTETYARRKREGEASKKASVGVGYYKDVEKKRIAMEIDITQEMRDENRYSEVGTLITDLSHFAPQRIDLDLTHRFTFSSATSYTDMDGDSVDVSTGDGLSLVNSSHTLKHSSDTYRNRVSGDPVFSKGALEAAELLTTTNILSNFGEKRVMNFNTIVTGDDPTTCNQVRQFLNSTADVDQSNSGVTNVYKGKYRHVKLPNLATDATGGNDSTKRRWWFLVAAGQGVKGWQGYYLEWEAPHLKDMPMDETGANHDYSRDIWTFGVRAGYGIAALSGRGLIGSLPTS